MSDIETSGAALTEPTATTPAAPKGGDKSASLGSDQAVNAGGDGNIPERSSQPDVQQQVSDFAFGSSRGSGLARGKRKIVTAPDTPPPQADIGGYQPTAIEVVTPKSEYSNPFTGETVVETPRQEKAPKVETPEVEAPPLSVAEKAFVPEVSTPRVEAETVAPTDAEDLPKPELKILPPAQPNRSRQSWESSSEHPARRAAANSTPTDDSAPAAPRSRSPRGSSEGRPTFQPERRARIPQNPEASEPSAGSAVLPREGRAKREPRERKDSRQPRSDRGQRAVAASSAPTPKPKGFFGWLKSLFGGGGNAPSSARPQSEQTRDGGPKRRSRSSRGRGGSHGPRDDNESYSNRRSGEKSVGQRSSSPDRNPQEPHRPRSRGGRGGRGRSGGPRPEGQQSGGAI